jgi:aminoglycoside phosphotransferase (APT) family kinase protein
VPVAEAVALCDDVTVNEAPFYVMGFVEGTIIRDRDVAVDVPEPVRSAACASLVRTMADLHRVDVDAVGLGDLGRRDGYIERQLKRWMTQVGQSMLADQPIFAEVHRRLSAAIPAQVGTAIVHGDFRLENTVIGPDDGALRAVLDWELCTLGDPLADLGLLLVYWPGPGEPDPVTPTSPTTLPGFWTQQQMIDGYGEASGRDLSLLPYYVAFSDWRLACIGAGVYTRFASGSMGQSEGIDLEQMRTGPVRRAERALALLTSSSSGEPAR